MDLLDKIKKQKNKVKYTIEDKTIAIGGMQGCGKTALLHELSNLLSKETGNDNIVLTAPFENGYGVYHDFRKYVPVLKDWYNEDDDLRDNIIDEEPKYIYNYEHLKLFTKEMIESKMQNPNFPVKIIAFDPISVLEEMLINDLVFKVYDKTGLKPTINSYGNYGLIYKDAINNFVQEILNPLQKVGYIPWFIFHIKVKKFNDKIYGEHDTYASKNSSSFFDAIKTMVDYSILFEDTMFNDKRALNSKDRTLRWRDGGNYSGAKARGTFIPETQIIEGLSDIEIAELVSKTIIDDLKSKENLSDEDFKIKIEEQRIKSKIENEIVLNNIKSIEEKHNKKEGNIKLRKEFGVRLKEILSSLKGDSLKQYQDYFNYYITTSGSKNIDEWVNVEKVSTLNDTIKAVNKAFSQTEGFELIKELI